LDEQGEMDKEAEDQHKKRQEYLTKQIKKIGNFIKTMERKEGKKREELKSNVTDNESAMIRSSSGFLQGYIGIAVSDKQNQIVISADAVGSANEGEHLPGILDNMLENMEEASVQTPKGKKLTVMMDNNYFSEENFMACRDRGLEAIIPDDQYKKRLGDKKEERHFDADDFTYHAKRDCFECPNGKRLKHTRGFVMKGREYDEYRSSTVDCNACLLKPRCIRSKGKEITKVTRRILMIPRKNKTENLCSQMRKKLDTKEYQNRYAHRIQIVEPVFASISYCKGLNRFMLRGKTKVNGQWKLYCMVHNLSKCLDRYNKKKLYA